MVATDEISGYGSNATLSSLGEWVEMTQGGITRKYR